MLDCRSTDLLQAGACHSSVSWGGVRIHQARRPFDGIPAPRLAVMDRGFLALSLATELPGYQITRQIGTGARSRILLGVQRETGKSFAIKHVVRESAQDDPFLKQMETEFSVSSNVNHPYLRQSIDLHRVRRLMQVRELFLVMEFVDGLTLEKARPNRLNTFLTISRRVAAGLHALHQAGFVHTDIKPTNILLGRNGLLKIIDFGQSCRMHHRKARIQGTPDYIAPEQVRRNLLDQRTDVFNLGATMYWLLTSENYPTQLRGTDSRGGRSLLSTDKPLAPIELNDKIPPALSKLVMDCCADNPANRPNDMKQVEARLVAVQKMWKRHRQTIREKFSAPADEGPPAIDAPQEDVP